jgi:hypothetical protein
MVFSSDDKVTMDLKQLKIAANSFFEMLLQVDNDGQIKPTGE